MTKRVLIIGNGPSAGLKNLVKRIDESDEFDIVVRFNCWRSDPRTVGSRCDVWVSNLHLDDTRHYLVEAKDKGYDPKAFMLVPDIDLDPGDKVEFFTELIRKTYGYDIDLNVLGLAPQRTLRKLFRRKPSAGAVVIDWFLRHGYDLTVHGFDILHRKNCPPSHYWGGGSDIRQIHNPDAEGRWLRELVNQAEVKILEAASNTAPPVGANSIYRGPYLFGRVSHDRFGTELGSLVRVSLNDNGSVVGSKHANEARWDVSEDGHLMFRHRDGTPTTTFDRVHVSKNTVLLPEMRVGAFTLGKEDHPAKHFLLPVLSAEEAIRQRKVGLLIATNHPYYETTLPPILENLADQGIPKDRVLVVNAQSPVEKSGRVTEFQGYRMLSSYLDAFEYSAMAAVGMFPEAMPDAEYFFVLHDTAVIGPDFWRRLHLDIPRDGEVSVLVRAWLCNFACFHRNFLRTSVQWWKDLHGMHKRSGNNIEFRRVYRRGGGYTATLWSPDNRHCETHRYAMGRGDRIVYPYPKSFSRCKRFFHNLDLIKYSRGPGTHDNNSRQLGDVREIKWMDNPPQEPVGLGEDGLLTQSPAIPATLHFVLLCDNLPDWAEHLVNRYREVNPEWEVDVITSVPDWLDETARRAIARRQNSPAEVTDIIRLAALARRGGFSFAIESLAIRPLDALRHMAPGWLIRAMNGRFSLVAMAAVPHSKFVTDVLDVASCTNGTPTSIAAEIMSAGEVPFWEIMRHYFRIFDTAITAKKFFVADDAGREAIIMKNKPQVLDDIFPFTLHLYDAVSAAENSAEDEESQ